MVLCVSTFRARRYVIGTSISVVYADCFGQNFAPEVKERASIYVPAIGKVTIAILLRNLLRLAQNQESAADDAANDANISETGGEVVQTNGH
jgi:5,10-methylene-tetrahydrofolate dehydrogenase/methenyl tetrahydrofolate cyclohydrolase